MNRHDFPCYLLSFICLEIASKRIYCIFFRDSLCYFALSFSFRRWNNICLFLGCRELLWQVQLFEDNREGPWKGICQVPQHFWILSNCPHCMIMQFVKMVSNLFFYCYVVLHGVRHGRPDSRHYKYRLSKVRKWHKWEKEYLSFSLLFNQQVICLTSSWSTSSFCLFICLFLTYCCCQYVYKSPASFLSHSSPV